jgi:cytosine/adenosine deaminase-related metal-dependent hydrolase/ubiquinone/menaquinone biosynthesis C-methylase UbiE
MAGAIQFTRPSSRAEQQLHFALWSRTYDDSANPMLSLEERWLAPLLPPIQNKNVLDVGCGTGRWLRRLATQGPRTLAGIDFSSEMLARAAEKLDPGIALLSSDATCLPVAGGSADVILSAFVASYVEDLDGFAAELRRVARPGSSIYLSDVHPETLITCKWKRGFRTRDEETELATYSRSLEDVVSCFEGAGFEAACLLEPPFGSAELETFRRAGKLDAFYAADGLPAIYVLQLRPVQSGDAALSADWASGAHVALRGARIALLAQEAIVADLDIERGHMASIQTTQYSSARRRTVRSPSADLDGYLLLPSLINAHDHLEFGLYPNLGRGPYANATEWAKDIQESESVAIALQQSVPRDVRLWWGAIRNLLCGVTTVCHHNPLHPELLDESFPIRVITNFGWAHSPALDRQLEEKFRSTPEDVPFVVHACEGLDDVSVNEIFELDRRGLLDGRTVVVHGLALTSDGIELLNRRGAALVWCPSSNRFLFGRTHSREAVASVRHLLLGSDSPLTAGGNLLDEVRIAHHEIGISASELYSILFDRAADVFRLTDGRGTIRADAAADVIAVCDRGLSPAEIVANLRVEDVQMVMVGGRVQLASEDMLKRLPPESVSGLEALQVDDVVRWVRAPLTRLFHEAQRILGSGIILGGKRVRHAGRS